MAQQLEQQSARSAKGWDELVDQLQASPDIQSFLRGMLDLQCKVVAAEYGALWLPQANGELQAVAAWPQKLTEQPADHPIIKMLAEAATSGAERGKSHVLKIEADGQVDPANPGLGAHVFVTAMKSGGQVKAVSTVVADCRDPKVIQTTAPLREIAAGLLAGYEAKKSSEVFQRETENVRNAMALLAVSQEGRKFKGAALNLVNELARQLKCTRVTIGWVKGKKVKLVSMSDTENLKRHSDEVARIELAMAECLDQQHPIVFPVPEGAEPLLEHAVVHAHRKVTNDHPQRYVTSIPMRVGDEWIGVLTLERQSEPFDTDLVKQLQLVVDVVAPHLEDRKVTSRWLPAHAWYSFTGMAGYLVGPKHVGWKALGLLAFAGLMYFIFGTRDYDVSSEFTFAAAESRLVSSPLDGELDAVHVKSSEDEKGFVAMGTVLASLKTTELTIQLGDVRAKYRAAELEAKRHLTDGNTSEMQQAQAMMEQHAAQIAQLEYQIEQAQIKSPIAGHIIQDGNLSDRIGGQLERGEQLFEVAQLDNLIVKIRVSESDIDEVRRQIEKNKGEPVTGLLRTRSEPDFKFRFTVEKILPMASPVDGANVFIVEAKMDRSPWNATRDYREHDTVTHKGMLFRAKVDTGPNHAGGAVTPPDPADLKAIRDATEKGKSIDADVVDRVRESETYWQRADWLRPGMEGTADIEAGRRPIRWIFTHEIVDTIKLWTWWPW